MIKNINDLEKVIKNILKETKYINFPGTEDTNKIDQEIEQSIDPIVQRLKDKKSKEIEITKGSYFELISKLKELILESGKKIESISIIREDDIKDIPYEFFRADCSINRNCVNSLNIYLAGLENFGEFEDIFFIEPERDAIMCIYSDLNNINYLLTVILN